MSRRRAIRIIKMPALPAREERCVNIEYVLTGLVALAIGVYLVVALLRPDKF